MAVGWAELADLRLRGMRPAKLVVTTQPWRCREHESEGALIVQHNSGEMFPVELLAGLDVLFVFDTCEQAHKARSVMSRRNIACRLRSFCGCEGEELWALMYRDCKHGEEVRKACPW